MTDRRDEPDKVADIFTEMLRMQGEAARQVMISFSPKTADSMPRGEDFEALGNAFMELQERVFAMSTKDDGKGGTTATPLFADPSQWMDLMQGWYKQVPGFDPGKQQEMWEEGLSLWQTLLTGYSDKGEGEDRLLSPERIAEARIFARQVGRLAFALTLVGISGQQRLPQ